MQITDLNTTESKQLMLVHSKIHYDNMDSVKQLSNHIEKKGYFKTRAGLVYKNALIDFLNGTNPSECIYCGSKLSEDHYLICKECNDKLINRAVEETEELPKEEPLAKDAIEETPKKRQSHEQLAEPVKKQRKIKTSVVIGICVVAIIAIIVAVGISIWSIKSANEAKEALTESSGNNAIDDMKSESVDDSYEDDEVALGSTTVDGFDFLGQSYDEVSKLLGFSEDVVDASTKYFASCGVSVIIDASSGRIGYIDNDGSGDGSLVIPVFGILPGASSKDAKAVFTEKGIDVVDYSDDSFMCMFQIGNDRNTTYEIDVTSNDDKVVLVAARIVY